MLKYPTEKEKNLLEAIQAQGDDGWEALVLHFEPMIMSIVEWEDYSFTAEVQEDVRQNILVHLRSAIPRFRGRSSLAYYIKCIAKNECINEVRRQIRHRRHLTSSIQRTPDNEWFEEEHADESMPDALQTILRAEQKGMIHETVQKLHPTCNESITLFYYENMTYTEIADHLGISRSTVGSRLHKCLEKLHDELLKLPLFRKPEA